MSVNFTPKGPLFHPQRARLKATAPERFRFSRELPEAAFTTDASSGSFDSSLPHYARSLIAQDDILVRGLNISMVCVWEKERLFGSP
jgi:hypothetical protein